MSSSPSSSTTKQPVCIKKKIKIKKSKVSSLKKSKESKELKMKSNKKKSPSSTPSIKLIDVKLDNVYDEEGKAFRIQLFGMNENGTTYSVIIDDFKPFLFVKIPNRCLRYKKQSINEVRQYINYKCNYLRIEDGKKIEYIDSIELVKRHKLYGFDNHKQYHILINQHGILFHFYLYKYNFLIYLNLLLLHLFL